jgi:hypothetical protein
MIIRKVNEAASKNFFFSSYTIYFTMLNNYFQHSHTSRTIASSQHHPRETRPLMSQPNLYENCYIGLTYVQFVSYITRNESIYLLTHFFLLSYIPFSFLYSHIMYEDETIYLLARFFPFSQNHFFILCMKLSNLFADSFFHTQQESIFIHMQQTICIRNFHMLYEVEQTICIRNFHMLYEVEQTICIRNFHMLYEVEQTICIRNFHMLYEVEQTIFIPNFHTQ